MTAAETLGAGIVHLRCANPGPMTLTGTNSYIVSLGPQAGELPDVAVIDPGPVEAPAEHLDGILSVAEHLTANRHVAVLLTHHHADHSGAVDSLVSRMRTNRLHVTVYGSGYERFPEALGPLRVLEAPGHTADSRCFFFAHGGVRVLFSGDTILGGSSSFVAFPDGNLTHYLHTLHQLEQLLDEAGETKLAPGHGEVGLDAATAVHKYRTHRQARLAQVEEVLQRYGRAASLDVVVAQVYPDIGPELRPAVNAIVQAQLEHLQQ